MARVLGYGGIANTNGARDFSGKEESEEIAVADAPNMMRNYRGIKPGAPMSLILKDVPA